MHLHPTASGFSGDFEQALTRCAMRVLGMGRKGACGSNGMANDAASDGIGGYFSASGHARLGVSTLARSTFKGWI